MKRGLLFLILGCFLMTGANGQDAVQAGASKQIWFGGVDPVAQSERHRSNPADYMDLFKPGAAWSTAAAATNVFKVGTAFILRGTDDQVRTVIEGLKRRHIALAVDIVTFIDLLQKTTGLKLAFMHMDVSWETDWRPQMELLVKRLRDRHIRVGVVFDGNEQSSSDKQWIEQALGHYKDITGNPATAVDDLVFQTWTPLPAKMLPETDPNAWSYAVKYAVTAGK